MTDDPNPATVPGMQLRIQITGEGPRRTVRLGGECDIASAPELREALVELHEQDVREVVLDLSALDFLDSSGIGVIVSALKRLRESGGDLRVTGAQGPVRKVLELTGLDRVLAPDPSEDA